MSTDYLSTSPLKINDFKHELEIAGLEFEHDNEISDCDGNCITYEDRYVNGEIHTQMTRWGGNKVGDIIEMITNVCEVDFVSEHEEEFKVLFESDDENSEEDLEIVLKNLEEMKKDELIDVVFEYMTPEQIAEKAEMLREYCA